VNITPISVAIADEGSNTNKCCPVVAIDPQSSQHARMEELRLLKSRGITRQKSAVLSCDVQSDLNSPDASPKCQKDTRKTHDLESMSYLRNLSSSQQAKMEQQARMKELQLLNLKGITGRKSLSLSSDDMLRNMKEEANKISQVEALDYLRKSSSSEQAKLEHRARMEELKLLGLKGITRQKSANLSSCEGLSDVNSFYSSQKCLKESMKKHYMESMEYLHSFQNNEFSSRKSTSRGSNNSNLSHDVAHEDPISEPSSENVVEMDPLEFSVKQPVIVKSDCSEEGKKDEDLNYDDVEKEEKNDDGSMHECDHKQIDDLTDIIRVVDYFVEAGIKTQHQGHSNEEKVDNPGEEKECDEPSTGKAVLLDATRDGYADMECYEHATSVESDVITLSSDLNIEEAVTVGSNVQEVEHQPVISTKLKKNSRNLSLSRTPKRIQKTVSVRSVRSKMRNEKTRLSTKCSSSPIKTGSQNIILSSPPGSLMRSPNTQRSAEYGSRKTRRTGSKPGFVNVISPSLMRSPNTQRPRTAEYDSRKTQRTGSKPGFANVISPCLSDRRDASARSIDSIHVTRRYCRNVSDLSGQSCRDFVSSRQLTRPYLRKAKSLKIMNSEVLHSVTTKNEFNSDELAAVALCVSSLKNGFIKNRKRMFAKSETKCAQKWEPKSHKELSGCEVCLSFANKKELSAYHMKGYHHRVMMTRGGCCKSCKIFPRNDSQSAPRICQRCFHDTHM